MLALLFLLLPIAAGYGWYMGRRGVQQNRQRRAGKLSRQYVTGLNFLLSDQPDKAVDHFIALLEVDSDTIETHLALGNLFRKRGEVDRAIRIHQNLIARPTLSDEQRSLAMLQLAGDYMAAGLYDRAETIFIQLSDDPDHETVALKQLISIYQQMKEWKKALAAGTRLIKLGNKRIHVQVAHFACELAQTVYQTGQIKKAKRWYLKALSFDPRCVRANIEMANLFTEQHADKEAKQYLTAVLDQEPILVSETLPQLTACFRQLDDHAGLKQYLRDALQAGAGIEVAIELAQIEALDGSPEAARALIRAELQRRPTLIGFHALMEYHLNEAEEGAAKNSLMMLKQLVAGQVRIRPGYRCSKCGYSTQTMNWQCPSCKQWGDVKPVRGLDGE